MMQNVFVARLQLLIEFILNLTIASDHKLLCHGMAPERAQDRNRPKTD
jgi:hypothetical protein